MEEQDLQESFVEKQKADIEFYKDQQEKFLQNITEEELKDYLLGVYEDNEKIIKKYDFNTISEDDIK